MNFFKNPLLKIEENGHTLSFYSIVFSRLCEQICLYFIAIVNSFMLSGYSAEAVTTSNVSAQIINLSIVLLSMIISGTIIHLSIYLGKKDYSQAATFCSTAFYTILAASFLVAVFAFIFSEKLLIMMNVEDYMLGMCISYLRVLVIFLPAKIIMSFFNNLLICNGYATNSLAIGITCNVLNALFSFIVLYTSIPLPCTKVTGVAFANGLATLISMGLAIILFKSKKAPFGKIFVPKQLKAILRLGIPGGMNSFSYNLSQTITTAFITLLGVAVFNTKVYVANIITFSYMISCSIGHAGSVFTGRYKGRRDYSAINTLYKRNILQAICSNIVVSAVIYIFHRQLIGIFTTDPETIRLAGQIMLIDIAVEIFRAVNNVSDLALNANGDVKITLFASVVACWVCSVLMSYILGIKLGFGLIGIWLAFLMDEMLKAIIYTIRWKSEKWMFIST